MKNLRIILDASLSLTPCIQAIQFVLLRWFLEFNCFSVPLISCRDDYISFQPGALLLSLYPHHLWFIPSIEENGPVKTYVNSNPLFKTVKYFPASDRIKARLHRVAYNVLNDLISYYLHTSTSEWVSTYSSSGLPASVTLATLQFPKYSLTLGPLHELFTQPVPPFKSWLKWLLYCWLA